MSAKESHVIVKMSKKGCCNFVRRFLQSLIPFAMLIVYCTFTAGILYSVENRYFDYYSKIQNTTTPLHCTWTIRQNGLWRSIHYVATLVTTIGYGDVITCSPAGQALSIVIALIGMPLMLVCLTRMGIWMEDNLNVLWPKIKNLLSCCCRKKKRKIKSSSSATPNSALSNGDLESAPLTLGLLVTLVWIILSSLYFYYTLKPYYTDKDYTFFTSFYFTMISLLTIGLGDVSPHSYRLVFANFIFITVGLALVTMCINILQTKLENLFEYTMKKIQQEYQKQVLEHEEGIAGMTMDGKKVSRNVDTLLKSNFESKWLAPLMSDSNKKKLQGEWQNKAKMISRACQATPRQQHSYTDTDSPEVRDMACQVVETSLRQIWK